MISASWLREFRDLLQALSRFYTPAHKRLLLKVSLWACMLSFLEMALAALVIPFIQCVGDQCAPSLLSLSSALNWPAVPAMSIGLLGLVMLKLGVQAALTWSAANLNQEVQRDTVSQLLDGYLHLNWPSFRSRHTTHYFRRCATTAVDAAYVSQQFVSLLSSALMLFFLIGLMLWQYPLASLSLGAAFLVLNLVTHRLIGQRQNQLAKDREAALQQWSLSMTEAFASFREIRVYELERFFLQHIDKSIQALASANKRLSFLPTLPRLIVDFALFAVLLSIISAWVMLQRPIAELMPLLVFYAVVARAILPAMINLLSTRAVLFGSIININLVIAELDLVKAEHKQRMGILPQQETRRRFMLEDVTFSHAPDLPPVITNGQLIIEHPSWVAVVGASGVGKSTLMELLCGVHVPQFGRVVHAWPDTSAPRLAYLPQHVALLEGTVFDNVVFGYDAGDMARIERALYHACLDDFVFADPKGCLAQIGADGAMLSGGQRQRLALARALYRQPDLLLLDEATSGLDEATETLLFSRLRENYPAMTVVFITHRQGSLRFADQVALITDGSINCLQ
jgi:ATP-binding cassette, subfamily B, bacterial PglK